MKKQSKILLLLVLALCLLTACKKGGTAALEVYDLGESAEDQVPALETVLQPDEALLYSIDSPTDAAVTEGLDLVHTYHYRQMADPALVAERYVSFLREEEQGMTLLDEENHRVLEDPNMETLYGSVILGKAGTEPEYGGKRIVRVIVGWSEYALAVQVAYVGGSIQAPVQPPKEEDPNNSSGQGGSGQSTPKPSSLPEQVDYLTSLGPQKLGLPGEDMSDYTVLGRDGWVTVDGISCREMSVFKINTKTAANELMGTYYLSSDGAKVYQKGSDGQITLLEIN